MCIVICAPKKFITKGHSKIKTQNAYKKIVYCLQTPEYARVISYLLYVIK